MSFCLICRIFGHSSLTYTFTNRLQEKFTSVYCKRCYSNIVSFIDAVDFIKRGENEKS